MLLSLQILPPLAFARVGRSPTPCPAFSWAPTDTSPGGTGKTSLEIEESFELDAAGTIKATRPNNIDFKDADGAFRPVCPFFELHGTWELGGTEHSGPITSQVLTDNGLPLTETGGRHHAAPHHLRALPLPRPAGDLRHHVGARPPQKAQRKG